VTVRHATGDDLDQVATLGGHFHEQTAWAKRIPYSHSDAVIWAQTMMDHGLLIVADNGEKLVGVVGGLKHPFLNNRSYIIGAELLWWIEPEYRNGGLGKQLLLTIEQAAFEAGCRLWSMMTLEAVEPEKAGAIYKKLGYELTEHSYLKEL
jgi:GNAT superfamily N-acetyltransferase